MLIANPSRRFLKETKLAQRRGLDLAKLDAIILLLATQQPLPARLHDHGLTGDWTGFRDCHIEPDWLLIYSRRSPSLSRTHSDLFD